MNVVCAGHGTALTPWDCVLLLLTLTVWTVCRNVGCMGLCSKCHRELASRAHTAKAAEAVVGSAVKGNTKGASPPVTPSALFAREAAAGGPPPPQSPLSPAAAGEPVVAPPAFRKPGMLQDATSGGAVAAKDDTQSVADASSRHWGPGTSGGGTTAGGAAANVLPAAATAGSPAPPSGGGATPTRCQQCRKKVGLTGKLPYLLNICGVMMALPVLTVTSRGVWDYCWCCFC